MANAVNNERVSQLVQIGATEISPVDLFFIADMSNKESKKLQASDLLTFVNISSSVINVSHAALADTASYILGTGVFGTVQSSSFANNSLSASHANQADNSSFSNTASFALSAPSSGTTATASFLLYSGVPNGTASAALTASSARNAFTSSFLFFIPGVNNGTSSFAMTASVVNSASFSQNAATASTVISSSFAQNAGSADTASFVLASQNGILSNATALSWATQAGTGATRSNPAQVTNLSCSLTVHSLSSKFLVMQSVAVGNPAVSGYICTALWRSSSVNPNAPIANNVAGWADSTSETTMIQTISYIDEPVLAPGSTIIYNARVFNQSGLSYLVNLSGDGGIGATSSMSVIEFIA